MSSSPPRWPRPACAAMSLTSISLRMAACWRRGRRSRASSPSTAEHEPGGGGKNPEVDFHGQRRSQRHAPLGHRSRGVALRKSNAHPAKLQYAAHVLMENRNGLIVDTELTAATGRAERQAAIELLGRLPGAGAKRRTLGVDKGYDSPDFVEACRNLKVTPHVAQNTSGRRSAIDGRTTSWPGYAISQRVRKRVEEIFGWTKTVGGCRKLRYIGRDRNRIWTLLAGASFNLTRIANLDYQTCPTT